MSIVWSETELIGMTPNITVNWDAKSGEQLSFPVGLGYIEMTKVGWFPVKWSIESQKYVIQPDAAGPEWSLKFLSHQSSWILLNKR